jgi:hypothetical protein
MSIDPSLKECMTMVIIRAQGGESLRTSYAILGQSVHLRCANLNFQGE